MRRARGIGRAVAALALCALGLRALPAAAEVRFGPGVRIGGHDFSNRRTGSVHIERVKRLRGLLGCRRLRHGSYRRGDGTVVRGPLEACNLVARPPARTDADRSAETAAGPQAVGADCGPGVWCSGLARLHALAYLLAPLEDILAITRDDVLKALAGITVDAAGTTLPGSGRLSQVVVDPNNRVMFSILVDASEAERFEPVRRQAEGQVLQMPGVSGVFASLTSERNQSHPAQSSAAPRPVTPPPVAPPRPGAPPNQGPQIAGVRHIVAVASGKGGVGKSTTACNIALALQAQGLKVGLLDADIYGPSVPKLFGLSGKPNVVDNKAMEPMVGYGLKVMSIGFLIEPETAMIWRGPMVQSAITQMLRDVLWGELDVLLGDMPPGTGDAQLTMAQATPLSGAVIVSTPQDLALIDARRGVTMFKKVAVPILGVIENMATFVCPHCGHASHIFGHGGARNEAQRLGVPFLGEVPLNMTIRETSDSGRPVVATDPEGPHAKVYRDIAAQLWANLSGAPAGRTAPKIVFE